MRMYVEVECAFIVVNQRAIEVVSSVKLLDLYISKNLKWICHETEISRLVSPRLYVTEKPKMASVATKELSTSLYTTCRHVIEYVACSRLSVVWDKRKSKASEKRRSSR